jgi:glycosyltransferase involved in cell wall biosynthesis
MREMKSRVFVGPGNIAGNAASVANSLRAVGIYARSYSYSVHPFGYKCDHENLLIQNPFPDPKKRNFMQKVLVNKYTLNVCRTIQKVIILIYALIKYNTFIFISHETFFSNNLDLRILRSFRKKIAFLFVGCPERDPGDIINKTDRGLCSFCNDFSTQQFLKCYCGQQKKNKIEYISEKADYIFSHRDTASFVLDKSKLRPFYCISSFELSKEEIIKKFKSLSVINITHLPSNHLLKSTSEVIRTIKQINSKYENINFLCARISHDNVLETLKKTHILIDQFTIGHGLLGVEGMASGCVVICRTAKWFKEDFSELPLINCNPDELTEMLINLIDNPGKMLEIALKSMEYYIKYHTPEVVGHYYKDTLNLN